MFEAGVAQVVEHEQSLVQLRVITDPGQQCIAFPADSPGNAQPGIGACRPGPFEGIQQVVVVLARLDGTDHQKHWFRRFENARQSRLDGGRNFAQVQFGAEVKIVEPQFTGLGRTQAALQFITHLIAHRGGNGHIAIGGFGDPVKPLVENLHQPCVVKLRMRHGNQVVNHRNDAHAFTFELFGKREEIGVPGRIQQHQLIPRLVLQRRATFGQLILVDALDRTQRKAETGDRCHPVGHVQQTLDHPRVASVVQALMQLPEAVSQAPKSSTKDHQGIEKRDVQRAEHQHSVEFALKHHNRDAFNTVDRFR
ncbi:hypothetical protein D3C71_1229040 [compost metagenome]